MTNSSGLALAPILYPRSAIEPVDPDRIPEIVKGLMIEQYFQVAFVTVLVFDARRYFIAQVVISTDILPSCHVR